MTVLPFCCFAVLPLTLKTAALQHNNTATQNGFFQELTSQR
jgi:hypothetical protein